MKRLIIILLHVGYWLLYLFLLFIIVLCIRMGVGTKGMAHLPNPVFISFLVAFAITPAVLGFYTFYNFLFAKFLKQKKILMLFVSGIIVSILCGVVGGFAIR